MTASTTSRATGGRTRLDGSAALAWAVVAAAVAEIVAPVVTISGPGASPGSGAGPDLLITPVGWAFSIWGVIYTLALAQAVAVLVRGPGAVSRRLQADLLVLYLGGTVWIVVAGLDSSLATAAALLVMLLAAVDGVLTVSRLPLVPTWFAVLTRSAVGLYAGWVTAAFFLNLSTALVDQGVVEADVVGWQLGVLVLAALTLLGVLAATRGVPAYAVAGVWALLGIAVTGATGDHPSVLVVALVGAVAIAAAALVVRRRAGGAN